MPAGRIMRQWKSRDKVIFALTAALVNVAALECLLAVQSYSRLLHSKSLPQQKLSSHVSSRTVPLANLSAGTFQWRCSSSSYCNCNVTVLILHCEVYFLHTVLLNTSTVFSLNFTCVRLKSCFDGNKRPHLWSSGQSFWLQIQRARVRFPPLPDFLSSSGSGTGSTQPREVN